MCDRHRLSLTDAECRLSVTDKNLQNKTVKYLGQELAELMVLLEGPQLPCLASLHQLAAPG